MLHNKGSYDDSDDPLSDFDQISLTLTSLDGWSQDGCQDQPTEIDENERHKTNTTRSAHQPPYESRRQRKNHIQASPQGIHKPIFQGERVLEDDHKNFKQQNQIFSSIPRRIRENLGSIIGIIILLSLAGLFLYALEVVWNDIEVKSHDNRENKLKRLKQVPLAPGIRDSADHDIGDIDRILNQDIINRNTNSHQHEKYKKSKGKGDNNYSSFEPPGISHHDYYYHNHTSTSPPHHRSAQSFVPVSELYGLGEEDETDTTDIPYQHPEITYYRREWVRHMARFAWDGYFYHCPGFDELKPVTGECSNWLQNGATAIDSLSLFLLMNETTRYHQALEITQALDPKLSTHSQVKRFGELFPLNADLTDRDDGEGQKDKKVDDNAIEWNLFEKEDNNGTIESDPDWIKLSTPLSSPTTPTTPIPPTKPITQIDIEASTRRVSMFETTIRVIAGFLSQYDLTLNPTYLQSAITIADAVMPAFDAHSTGFPSSVIDLMNGSGHNNQWCQNCYILADVATIQVEFCGLTSAILAYEAAYNAVTQNTHLGNQNDDNNNSHDGRMDTINPVERSTITSKKRSRSSSTFPSLTQTPFQFTSIYHPHEYCQRAHHVTTLLYALLHSQPGPQHQHLLPQNLHVDTPTQTYYNRHGHSGLNVRRGARGGEQEHADLQLGRVQRSNKAVDNTTKAYSWYIEDNMSYYGPLLLGQSYSDLSLSSHLRNHWVTRHTEEDELYHNIPAPQRHFPNSNKKRMDDYNPVFPGYYTRIEHESGDLLPYDPRVFLMSIHAHNSTNTELPNLYHTIAPHWVKLLYTSPTDRNDYHNQTRDVVIGDETIYLLGKDAVEYNNTQLAKLYTGQWSGYYGLEVDSIFIAQCFKSPNDLSLLPKAPKQRLDNNIEVGESRNNNQTLAHFDSLEPLSPLEMNIDPSSLITPSSTTLITQTSPSFTPSHLDPYNPDPQDIRLSNDELVSPIRESLSSLFNAYYSSPSAPTAIPLENTTPDSHHSFDPISSTTKKLTPHLTEHQQYSQQTFSQKRHNSISSTSPPPQTSIPILPPQFSPDDTSNEFIYYPIPASLHHTYTTMTQFVGKPHNYILGVGPMSDSTYEYFLKTWISTGKVNPIYLDAFQKTIRAILTHVYSELDKTPQFIAKMRYARYMNRFYEPGSRYGYDVTSFFFPSIDSPNGFHRFDGVHHNLGQNYPSIDYMLNRDIWVNVTTTDDPSTTQFPLFDGSFSTWQQADVIKKKQALQQHTPQPSYSDSTLKKNRSNPSSQQVPTNPKRSFQKRPTTTLPSIPSLINPKIHNRVIKWVTTNPISIMVQHNVGVGSVLSVDTASAGSMHHLSCFLPGTIALGLIHGAFDNPNYPGKQNYTFAEEALQKAEALVRGCVMGYLMVQHTGLAPENYKFHTRPQTPFRRRNKIDQEDESTNKETPQTPTTPPPNLFPGAYFTTYNNSHFADIDISSNEHQAGHYQSLKNLRQAPKHGELITTTSSNFNLRPETLESLYLLYRLTGKQVYREIIWLILSSIQRYCRVRYGYTNYKDVFDHENSDDRQESFLLSEVFKYAWLSFEEGASEPIDPFNGPTRKIVPPKNLNYDEIVKRVRRRKLEHERAIHHPDTTTTKNHTPPPLDEIDSPFTSPNARTNRDSVYKRLSESNFVDWVIRNTNQTDGDHQRPLLSKPSVHNSEAFIIKDGSARPQNIPNSHNPHHLFDLHRFVLNTEGHPIRIRNLNIDEMLIEVLDG